MGKRSRSKMKSVHPYRLALAGGWGDHNVVNFLADGYVAVVQVKPTITFRDRCGICSSTRKILMQRCPRGIPRNIDRYKLAPNLYYWENQRQVPVGGSQDAWGSVYPGFNLLHYDFRHHNGVLPKEVRCVHGETRPGHGTGISACGVLLLGFRAVCLESDDDSEGDR